MFAIVMFGYTLTALVCLAFLVGLIYGIIVDSEFRYTVLGWIAVILFFALFYVMVKYPAPWNWPKDNACQGATCPLEKP